jgi:ABC-type transport system involved in cytochrome c biogenesis permease component
MKRWIAFWNILIKDMRAYYLKPPNISWGLIFPLAWTGMFFIKSGGSVENVQSLIPGVVTVSILFGTTSMLAVTVTFEKKGRSFDRLLLAPMPLELLMLAKTSGAILFGVANAFVPIVLATFLVRPVFLHRAAADLSASAVLCASPDLRRRHSARCLHRRQHHGLRPRLLCPWRLLHLLVRLEPAQHQAQMDSLNNVRF